MDNSRNNQRLIEDDASDDMTNNTLESKSIFRSNGTIPNMTENQNHQSRSHQIPSHRVRHLLHSI